MKNFFRREQTGSTSNRRRRRTISTLLAGIAVTLFSILVMDTIVGQTGLGFLQMDTQHKGPIFGVLPIVLFLASFGIGYKERSKLTSILLIVGGTMIITFWLVVPFMGWFLYFYIVLRSIYDLQIVLGAVITGLGVLRVVQEYKMKECDRRIPNQDSSKCKNHLTDPTC